MRHAPPARSRVRRVAALAPLPLSLLLSILLSLWCAAQAPAAVARTPSPAASAAAASTAPAPAPAPVVRTGETEDHSSALVPIVVGLVLTGIASYKHRGLPRGH
jgi:hypothetical protein